jgi:4-amino-4-deoxy-L-arabinose transferase-like glycosyltransferase
MRQHSRQAFVRDRALTAIVVLALVVRLAYWLSKWNHHLLFNDSLYYSGQAHSLAHGHLFRDLFFDEPGAEHGPLTSLLMAPVSYGAGYLHWQRLVTVVCGTVTVWAIGRFGRGLAGRTAGLVAAAIAAVYPNMWITDGLVMSESVSILCVVLVLWTAHVAAASDRTRAPVVAGVTLGLAMLARSELLLMAPLVLVWLAIARRRSALPARRAILVAGALTMLTVSPWVLFNLVRFERTTFLTTNDGSTLMGANCDDMYSGGNAGGWTILCVHYDQSMQEPSVRSAYMRTQGLHYVRTHLRGVPHVVAARLGRSLDLYGLSDMLHQDVGEERPRWAAIAGIGAFWVLALVAAAGALLTRRRDRWLLLLPIVVALVASVVFYGGHRIRSTAEPSIVLLAAVAVAPRIDRLRRLSPAS